MKLDPSGIQTLLRAVEKAKLAIALKGARAQVLGLEKEPGTVEEGKLADLILIEGNPLEDIEILAKRELIRLVMKDGKQVSGEFF